MTHAQEELVLRVGMAVERLEWTLRAIHRGFNSPPEMTVAMHWECYVDSLVEVDHAVTRVLAELWVASLTERNPWHYSPVIWAERS